MRLFIAALARFQLLFKAAALLIRIIELAEPVSNFHFSGEDFEALYPVCFVRFVLGQRRHRNRELVNNRRLHQVLFGYRLKQGRDGFSSGLVGIVCHVSVGGIESCDQRFH